MNLLDSLLDAIVRLDGDALVMHVGEKPYVVTTSDAVNEFRGPLSWGQVELSSRDLTAEAVGGMLVQILPLDERSALDELGAIEYEVPASNQFDRFTIVAARGGDDIWLEVRRYRKAQAKPAAAPAAEAAPTPVEPVEHATPAAVTAAAEEPAPAHAAVAVEPEVAAAAAPDHESTAAAADAEEPAVLQASEPEPVAAEVPLAADEAAEPVAPDPLLPDEVVELKSPPLTTDADIDAMLIAATEEWGDDVMTEGELGELLRASAGAVITVDGERESLDWSEEEEEEEVIDLSSVTSSVANTRDEEQAVDEEQPVDEDAAEPTTIELPDMPIAAASSSRSEDVMNLVDELSDLPPIEVADEPDHQPAIASAAEPRPQEPAIHEHHAASIEEIVSVEEEPQEVVPLQVEESAGLDEPIMTAADTEPQPVVANKPEREIPASRPPAIVVPLPRQPKSDAAVGARASAGATLQRLLKLAAGHGAATVYIVAQTAPLIRVDGEFSALDGEAAMSAAFVDRLVSEVLPESRDSASPSADCLIDVPEIGRVRCVTFRDHRGPGVIFRMVPARAISADQLGLSTEVQALCTEADGLVLVTGARGSGKSTLLTSFVDLINRTRSDHIITAESQIEFVHENKRSFISQREVRGDGDGFNAALRAACREEPDVLVIEDMRSPEVVTLALEAAESGRLVFASVPGLSIASALERIIEMFPAERREKLQTSLAGTLRGVVSQVLLRKLRGGRVAAREVLINTASVANLILEGKTFQLSAAIENGRRAGMMSFAESLALLVREGVVHASHAYRKAPNREQFLAILRRDGVDASITERLA